MCVILDLLCVLLFKAMTNESLSKDDILKLAVRITKEMGTEEFKEKVRRRLEEKNTPPTQAVMAEFEQVQVQVFQEWGFDGASALRQLKLAVRTYPDPDTRIAIGQLCQAEESLLMVVSQEVATRFGQVIPEGDSHGHSHNGKPCHGHGHEASHGHSHGGSHGHSHNGQPCHGHDHGHGHGQPNPQQMMAMQMALQSLSPAMKTDFEAIQKKMMTGGQPTAQDQEKMMAIQQHLVAYMSTMQQFAKQQQHAGKN